MDGFSLGRSERDQRAAPNPDALGSVNTSLIPATQTGGATGGLTTSLGSQDPFTFGEAAISFEALFGSAARAARSVRPT